MLITSDPEWRKFYGRQNCNHCGRYANIVWHGLIHDWEDEDIDKESEESSIPYNTFLCLDCAKGLAFGLMRDITAFHLGDKEATRRYKEALAAGLFPPTP